MKNVLLVICLFVSSFVRAGIHDTLSIEDFGARQGSAFDCYNALDSAAKYVIAHGVKLWIPIGTYNYSKPWLWQNVVNGKWAFFTANIEGMLDAKSGADGYLSILNYTGTTGFAIGFQFGRGITIKNIYLTGKYTFPQSINNFNIGTTKYASWSTGVDDGRFRPYAGIVFDPFCDSNHILPADRYTGLDKYYLPGTGRGGTSGATITHCGIHYFSVGVMLTPNPWTQNDEMISVTEDCIDNVKIAVAIGQDQSKEIHVDNIKVWASTYTVVDGLMYGVGGLGNAPCSVNMSGGNIAGNVNQLLNINAGRFPLSVKDVVAESLFRIGYVYGTAGVNIDNCQINLLSGPGMPAADYIFSGGPVTFSGGHIFYYDASFTHRMNMSQQTALYQNLAFSNAPFITGLYAYGVNGHPTPTFGNIHLYYPNTTMKPIFDTLILIAKSAVTINSNWTATITYTNTQIKVGDYIFAGPSDAGGHYYDQLMNPGQASTIQLGRVTSIVGTVVNLDDVGLNAYPGSSYGAFYISKLK